MRQALYDERANACAPARSHAASARPVEEGDDVPALAQLFLLDILFTRLCPLDQDRCGQNRQAIAAALADKHL